MSARLVDAAPAPARLPEGSALRRTIRTPETPPPQDFLDAFDDRTLVYDCFRDSWGRLLLVCPAPMNLFPLWRRASFHAGGTKLRAQFHLSLSQMIVELAGAPPHAAAVTMIFEGEPHEMMVDGGLDAFAGRRIIFTMNKNNDLAWIREWARHHASTQGSDAAVVFDNGSTRYSAEDVAATLAAVPGLAVVSVPSWPLPFGALDPRTRFNPYWSHFLQNASMSVVLRRLGGRAHSLLNCDIDELAWAGPDQSVHEIVRASRSGFVTFKGQWVEPVAEPDAAQPPVHRDFVTRLKDEKARGCRNSKWAIDPTRPWLKRLNIHPYWHWLANRPLLAKQRRKDVLYWHFKGINTNWKAARAVGGTFEPERHEPDPVLAMLRERVT